MPYQNNNVYQQILDSGQPLTNNQLAQYYNNKYPKTKIYRILSYTPYKIKLDAKTEFFKPNDQFIKEYTRNIRIPKNKLNDHKAYVIQRYINRNIDINSLEYNCPEFLIHTKIGCQKSATVLLANCLLAIGIKSSRVRIAIDQDKNFYCCYLKESNNQWVHLSVGNEEDFNTPVPRKPKFDSSHIIASFNDKYCWGQKVLKL